MGTNVLIIGASGDIGKQISIQLGHEGYSLILHYHQNKTAIEAIQRELPREGILDTIKADLTNQAGINRLLANVAYPVDAIVFASGIAYYGLFQETPEQIMEEMLSIHVKAPMLISKDALPSMIKKKSGNIILISSVWGEIGASYEVLYSAVKGSQISFVKALAKEVGPSGIRVNAVSPGYIDTKMNPLSFEEKEQIVSEIPLNRPGTPRDVADVVSFLLSEKAGYIQGEVLRVTGGWV
jgi:3-oxoacyl-[acyl-carrier protein] reductase